VALGGGPFFVFTGIPPIVPPQVSIVGEPHMAKTLTATDRKSLIRLASTMAVGSPERRAILAVFLSASWFPKEIYETYEEWQEEWQARIDAREDNPSWQTIARGFVSHNDNMPLPLAERIIAGKASSKDILGLLGNTVGVWWYLIGHGGDIEDAESFAEAEEHLGTRDTQYELDAARKGHNVYGEPVDGVDFAVVSIVLIAERPEGWHPDDNPDGGLMGNSQIDTKKWKTVKLKAVRYFTGEKWVQVSASGTVKL
jgi:hypothetical protein